MSARRDPHPGAELGEVLAAFEALAHELRRLRERLETDEIAREVRLLRQHLEHRAATARRPPDPPEAREFLPWHPPPRKDA